MRIIGTFTTPLELAREQQARPRTFPIQTPQFQCYEDAGMCFGVGERETWRTW